MSEHEKRGWPASASVARHLVRGGIGFGLIGSGFTLIQIAGPAALLLTPIGMIALRGCPTCWVAGLIQTVSAGRLQRACLDSSCGLRQTPEAHDETSHLESIPFGLDLDQIYAEHLCAGDSALALAGQRHPALVSYVAIERRLRGELQHVDLQGPAIDAIAAHALKDPRTMVSQQLQDPVLVMDKCRLGARVRPEQNA